MSVDDELRALERASRETGAVEDLNRYLDAIVSRRFFQHLVWTIEQHKVVVEAQMAVVMEPFIDRAVAHCTVRVLSNIALTPSVYPYVPAEFRLYDLAQSEERRREHHNADSLLFTFTEGRKQPTSAKIYTDEIMEARAVVRGLHLGDEFFIDVPFNASYRNRRIRLAPSVVIWTPTQEDVERVRDRAD